MEVVLIKENEMICGSGGDSIGIGIGGGGGSVASKERDILLEDEEVEKLW